MFKPSMRFALFCMPLLMLSACGEGWEFQRVDNAVPYSSRTAGTGVAYVRAKMLPKKEVVVDTVVEEVAPIVETPAPVLKAEEIFEDVQGKGGVITKRRVVAPKVMDTPEAEPQAVLTPMPEMSKDEVAPLTAADLTAGNVDVISAEDYIAQSPKRIETPDVVVIEQDADIVPKADGMTVEEIAPRKGLSVEPLSENDVYEQETITTVPAIVSPHKTLISDASQGQKHLDDIYHDPLY